VLGAVAHATERMELATMVTCPIIRYHPAIIAQAAATVAVMSEDRFTLGLGAGERLNEHVVGAGWPPADVRHEMLAEAVDVMRLLWSGDYVSHRGRHFTVEDARIFDLPERAIEIFVAASGADSVALAAESADGMCATEPDGDLVQAYLAAGGAQAATWSWHPDEAKGKDQALDQFRFGHPGWKVMAELPNPVNFAAATETVTADHMAEMIPCGPDPERHVEGIRQYAEAGFENIAAVQVGADQEGFLRFWQKEVVPRL
jgi:G6PDH family F420-dependent oxidoreductase